jgi:hypothetical protein
MTAPIIECPHCGFSASTDEEHCGWCSGFLAVPARPETKDTMPMYELDKTQDQRTISHTHRVEYEFIDPEPFTLASGATYRPIKLGITYEWVEGEPLFAWNTDGRVKLRAIRIRKDGTVGDTKTFDGGVPAAFSALAMRLAKENRPADMPDSKEQG